MPGQATSCVSSQQDRNFILTHQHLMPPQLEDDSFTVRRVKEKGTGRGGEIMMRDPEIPVMTEAVEVITDSTLLTREDNYSANQSKVKRKTARGLKVNDQMKLTRGESSVTGGGQAPSPPRLLSKHGPASNHLTLSSQSPASSLAVSTSTSRTSQPGATMSMRTLRQHLRQPSTSQPSQRSSKPSQSSSESSMKPSSPHVSGISVSRQNSRNGADLKQAKALLSGHHPQQTATGSSSIVPAQQHQQKQSTCGENNTKSVVPHRQSPTIAERLHSGQPCSSTGSFLRRTPKLPLVSSAGYNSAVAAI
eukprot:GHVN01009680.1.p1 GENE.GHVN01009680.1~~GHVN01009680.1.p1  ORF type:complete len:306 (+),score=78.71 GHVN01009680.1:755-1672(+)